MSNIEHQEDFSEANETGITDETETDIKVVPLRYDIASYGADYDVEGLVKRLDRKDILIPEFQRSYVWKFTEASRFVESLLLGLPVPGIFLAREQKTNKFLVLDGQQRLRTLQFFHNGVFNPQKDDRKHRIFALTKVQDRFEGKTYLALEERDRLRFDNSIIHATVVHQESPQDDDTSMYHIFERLNNGGRRLTPQEIRCAIYHGPLMEEVKSLNDYLTWRKIFGKMNHRLKDQELILRFLALYPGENAYQSPMSEFLNKFANKYRNADQNFLGACRHLFESTIDIVWNALGHKAFRPERALNAAVFDSVMVGLARRVRNHGSAEPTKFREAYGRLLSDEKYLEAMSRSTANEASVSSRIQKATEYFSEI